MPPTSAEPALLLDTSVAVALVVADHAAHESTFSALRGHHLGLAGHAWFETFSVLTRLPPPSRLSPAAAVRLLQGNFPHTRLLSSEGATALLAELPAHGVSGGAVYDALVGAAAREHGLGLVSRDRRALQVYRRIGVDVRMLD